MIHSKQHRGCRIQDPGTRGKHQTTTKKPWCTSRGCRVQNSGPRDPWLPVVKNRRLLAQRTVRPFVVILSGWSPHPMFAPSPQLHQTKRVNVPSGPRPKDQEMHRPDQRLVMARIVSITACRICPFCTLPAPPGAGAA